MEVRLVPVDQVVPYARNPRRNQGEIAKVAASLREFGWRQPIVVDSEMTVVVGHTRLAAAISLGMTEVPIHVAAGLTPAQVKAYRLADNRVGEEAQWDAQLLQLELGDLKDESFDQVLTGFSETELTNYLHLGEESDLVDPTDGAGQTAGEPQNTLNWGDKAVPLTQEEVALLERAYAKHTTKHGVAHGFVRQTLARVDLRS
jgi:ParB-like chromosome segregation protein Spo0J